MSAPLRPRRSLVALLASVLSVLSAALLAGCVDLAPAYTRPAAPVAAAWSVAPASAAPMASTASLASVVSVAAMPVAAGTADAPDLGWRDFLVDTRLKRVVELALANNRDLRVAVANIAQARAQYRVQDAARLPAVSAGVSAARSRAGAVTGSSYAVNLGLAGYELDLFGRVKNLSDAALQSYLSTEEAARSTRISLVAEVATAWLTYAADAERLALAGQTLASDRRSLELTRRMHDLGSTTGLVVAQAQSAAESARASAAAYRAQLAQDLDALVLLAGAEVPADLLPAQAPVDDASVLVGVPGGLPARLLQQRPDVLSAEHTLQSAQQDIGAARAAFFPAISLTAGAGTASVALSGLFKSGSGAWNFGPAISLPIFDGGARQADLDSARATRDAALATYEKTVQTAFREVADALAVRSTLAEQIDAQQAVTSASRTSLRLADALFRNGSTGYLDVLEAQRTLYASQQAQITLTLAEQGNRITLYKALGGGWKESS